MVPVMTVDKFERFFRAAAGLDVDKKDLKRYSDFVDHKIYDLLLRGKAAAKENGRDIIQPSDLPITKGLQEDAARERPSATAPRDWAARHNEITGAPRLERRDDDAGGPSLAPAPTTPETRALGPVGARRP